jgi:hypothetical protein
VTEVYKYFRSSKKNNLKSPHKDITLVHSIIFIHNLIHKFIQEHHTKQLKFIQSHVHFLYSSFSFSFMYIISPSSSNYLNIIYSHILIEDLCFRESLCLQESMEWSSSVTLSSSLTSNQTESVQNIVVKSLLQSKVFTTSLFTIKMGKKRVKLEHYYFSLITHSII